MILDTTVLVDLQREQRKGDRGKAHQFFSDVALEVFRISFVTRMEFAEGFDGRRRETLEHFLAPFTVVYPDAETCWIAGQIARDLKSRGKPIGDHDTWIAASAIQIGEPVVTRNAKHLGLVDGLDIVSY